MTHAVPPAPSRRRRSARLRGVVQGVGFRPAVCRLATGLGLDGFVRNDGDEVRVEVEGDEDRVERFLAGLRQLAPPPARVDDVEIAERPLARGRGFEVAPSTGAAVRRTASIPIPPDRAPCDDCLRELADPDDRRHRYALTTCTTCGPRFTVALGVPHDRARTTMDAFPPCPACRREHDDPDDRRFHAQTISCPTCGPEVAFEAGGARVVGREAITAAAEALHAGAIVAVKGVGGYALAVDATSAEAVARLRARKRRPHKPFAVMVRDLEAARRIVVVDEVAERALLSPARPIVLLPVRPDAGVAPDVAPGLTELGVFLPPSPLQHLLLAEGPPLQVMTSGNLVDEPIVIDDEDERLGAVADAVLRHARPIAARCDDSVVRPIDGVPVPLRRARGYVPDAIVLPVDGPPVLAVGAASRGTVCLAAGGRAVLSAHLGDARGHAAARAFEDAVAHLVALAGVTPVAVAHDLHPDHPGTRWAERSGLRLVPVAHHHAHLAACLAEHGRTGPAIGVAFDGTGLGPDGTLWGGEVLVGDLRACRRVAHLRPLRLLGAEAAIRQPWRLALAALHDAGLAPDPVDAPGPLRDGVVQLAERGLGPTSTGAGRWFDAVAALCGVRVEATYDGQAAIELEAHAAPGPADPYPLAADGTPLELDLRPTVRAIADERARGVPTPTIAARFHETLAQAVLVGVRRAHAASGLRVVALTGGCFQNRRLAERAAALLRGDGFQVLTHRLVPPSDGGLSLGQAAIATATVVGAG
jgi:hydrogenase maturation protein HypF